MQLSKKDMDLTTLENSSFLQPEAGYEKDMVNSTSTLETESKTITIHTVTN